MSSQFPFPHPALKQPGISTGPNPRWLQSKGRVRSSLKKGGIRWHGTRRVQSRIVLQECADGSVFTRVRPEIRERCFRHGHVGGTLRDTFRPVIPPCSHVAVVLEREAEHRSYFRANVGFCVTASRVWFFFFLPPPRPWQRCNCTKWAVTKQWVFATVVLFLSLQKDKRSDVTVAE